MYMVANSVRNSNNSGNVNLKNKKMLPKKPFGFMEAFFASIFLNPSLITRLFLVLHHNFVYLYYRFNISEIW